MPSIMTNPKSTCWRAAGTAGETWTIENPAAKAERSIPVGKALHGITPPGLREKSWRDCPGDIDFTHPDFALAVRMTDVDAGPSRFYYSTDRGHHWDGPFALPLFGQAGIAARTDYIVNGPSDCMLFLTASKADRQEGRPLCVRTTDGGQVMAVYLVDRSRARGDSRSCPRRSGWQIASC